MTIYDDSSTLTGSELGDTVRYELALQRFMIDVDDSLAYARIALAQARDRDLRYAATGESVVPRLTESYAYIQRLHRVLDAAYYTRRDDRFYRVAWLYAKWRARAPMHDVYIERSVRLTNTYSAK